MCKHHCLHCVVYIHTCMQATYLLDHRVNVCQLVVSCLPVCVVLRTYACTKIIVLIGILCGVEGVKVIYS